VQDYKNIQKTYNMENIKPPELLTIEERIEIYKEIITWIESDPLSPHICNKIILILRQRNKNWGNYIESNSLTTCTPRTPGDHFFEKYFPEFFKNKPLKSQLFYDDYTRRPWWSTYDYKSRIDYLKKLIQLLEDQNNE